MSATLLAPPAPPVPHQTLELPTAAGRLVVRSLLPTDGPRLARAVAQLSPRSRYQRFLSPKPSLSAREIAALTDVDHREREALVALHPAGGAWIAVARYAAFADDPQTADVAITVADSWQRRGVGTALVGLLADRARDAGIARLHATTLLDNEPALRLLRRHGFRPIARDHGTLELIRDLPAQPAPRW